MVLALLENGVCRLVVKEPGVFHAALDRHWGGHVVPGPRGGAAVEQEGKHVSVVRALARATMCFMVMRLDINTHEHM